jgi:hypothetical protein
MNIINVLITIDTNSIKAAYPKPSQDSSKPTGIAHKYGFMVATGTTVNSGQGTGDLSFQALVGDQVEVFGVSGSDNFDDAVLVYGMPKYGGTQVFGTFENYMYSKSTVEPSSNSGSVLPPQTVTTNFWFYQAPIVASGTENYKVQFGLWSRNSAGAPELFGYFSWDPTITVAG